MKTYSKSSPLTSPYVKKEKNEGFDVGTGTMETKQLEQGDDLVVVDPDFEVLFATTSAPFVHVTPRYNVETVHHNNFYDLVIATVSSRKTLHSTQKYQLSRTGLLYTEIGRDGNTSVLIPLREIMEEKAQLLVLRQLTFFGRFKEGKSFRAWRSLARKGRVQRSREMIKMSAAFAFAPLVKASLLITEELHKLETDIDLYEFVGHGAVNCSEYFDAQSKKMTSMIDFIASRLEQVADGIVVQYNSLLGDDHLQKDIEEIKAHHPYAGAENAGFEVDWANLRSVQRRSDESRRHLDRLLVRAQFMLEGVLGRILITFWRRVLYALQGIRFATIRKLRTRVVDDKDLEAPRPTSSSTVSNVRKAVAVWSLQDAERMLVKHHGGMEDNEEIAGPLKVTKSWEEEGFHLRVDLDVFLKGVSVEPLSLADVDSITGLKIKVLPSKSDLMSLLYDLYRSLGILLESVPDFRRIGSSISDLAAKVATASDGRIPSAPGADTATTLIAAATDHASSSSSYFAYVQSHSILKSAGGLTYATSCLTAFAAAYEEACSCGELIVSLEDAFRRLFAINPRGLANQMERSMVLSKLKIIMNTPDFVDDISRSMESEKKRFSLLRKAVEHLREAQQLLEIFPDLKQSLGLVTSFQQVNAQVIEFRNIQYERLYGNMPKTFLTRCGDFVAYSKIIENFFELTSPDLDGLMSLMRALRSFDDAKELYDLETEIIDEIFVMLEQHVLVEPVEGSGSRNLQLPAAEVRSIRTLHKSYKDAKTRLFTSVSRSRSLLLGQLPLISNDTKARRRGLHSRITHEREVLMQPIFYEKNSSTVACVSALEEAEKSIVVVRQDVNNMLRMQAILVTGHDLIGVAEPVLSEKDVDSFPDMADLETLLSYRSKAWGSMVRINAMKRRILACRISGCEVPLSMRLLDEFKSNYEHLVNHIEEGGILEQLAAIIAEVEPKLDVVACLSSPFLKPHHWHWLSDYVLRYCGLSLKLAGQSSEIVKVLDMNVPLGHEPVGMGEFHRFPVNDLLYRGIESHLPLVQHVTTDAAVEHMIDHVLEQLSYTLRSLKASVAFSREGHLTLVANLPHTGVLSLYSNKVLQLLDSVSLELSLTSFRANIDRSRETTAILGNFVADVYCIQTLIGKLNSFIKNSQPSEVSGELAKDFSSCVEDFKKLGQAFQQKSMNMWATCDSLVEFDISTDGMKSTLLSLLEDFHSNIQSYVDACPRLSMLPYNRLLVLASIWLGGPYEHMHVVNECMRAMFEGIGGLLLAPAVVVSSSSTTSKVAYACVGCVSVDKSEELEFAEEIPLDVSLFDFVCSFENQLRSCIAKPCDFLLLQRVQSLRSMLTDSSSQQIVRQLISRVFALRVATDQLAESARRNHSNFTVVLTSASNFSEDVWTCLGHPMGSLLLARPDLKSASASTTFETEWKSSLTLLLKNSKDIMTRMQKALRLTSTDFQHGSQKSRSLAVSLMLQEIELMRNVEAMLSCATVEEAKEMWTNNYQLCTVYDVKERVRMSPFEVSLGAFTVAFGLEYPGGLISVVPRGDVQRVLHHVVSASSCNKMSVLMNSLALGSSRWDVHGLRAREREASVGGNTPSSAAFSSSEATLLQSEGELSVTARDISSALGRICTTLMTISSSASVRLFLSRLVYMDAIGTVELSCADQRALDTFSNTLTTFIGALEKKQDVFIQDGLKYSFPTRYNRKEAQLQRRKDNLSFLRHHLNNTMKLNRDVGLLLVGMLSEDQFVDSVVFKSIIRGCMFSVIQDECAVPVAGLGLLLTAVGFEFGVEIQHIFHMTLRQLRQRHAAFTNIVRALSSSLMLRAVAKQAGEALGMINFMKSDKATTAARRGKNPVDTSSASLWQAVGNLPNDSGQESLQRLKAEVEFFTASLWENTLLVSVGMTLLDSSSWEVFRRELLGLFERELEAVFATSNVSATILSGGQESQQRQTVAAIASVSKNMQGKPSLVSSFTPLDLIVGDKLLTMPRTVKSIVQKSASELGLSPGVQFVRQCAHMWASLCDLRHTVTVISGPLACGKSSVLQTAIHIIGSVGTAPALLLHANSRCMTVWRAAAIIKRTVLAWLKSALRLNSRGKRPEKGSQNGVTSKVVVHTSIIHHASVPAMYLLGSYDSKGTWMDGLLLRAIRKTDAINGSSALQHWHVIVLDGPCGPFVEQLFGASYYQPHSRPVSLSDRISGHVSMPTGEIDLLASNIKIVLETGDLSHASPALVSQLPLMHLETDTDTSVQRLVAVWYKSLCHWLDHFPPWTEVLAEIGRWLLDSRLIQSCLYHDISINEMPTAVAVSRIGTFLRCFEELLVQCHELAIAESVFVDQDHLEGNNGTFGVAVSASTEQQGIGRENGPTSGSLQNEIATQQTKVMTLGPKGRIKLMRRVQQAVGYAAVWGFGGSGNTSDKRRLFDSIVRDNLYLYVTRGGFEIIIPEEFSVFEVIINLEKLTMEHAADVSPRGVVKHCFGVSDRYQDYNVSTEVVSTGNLVFNTPNTRSVMSILRLLHASGANPLLLGPRGCGKSFIISRMLSDRSRNVPSTPAQVRLDTLKNLVRIVANYEVKGRKAHPGDEDKLDDIEKGTIAAVMEACTSALRRLEHLTKKSVGTDAAVGASMSDVQACWQAVRDACKVPLLILFRNLVSL